MARPDFGTQAFSSFAGADIRASFGNTEIGELQAISYMIQREKAPIYTLGQKNPISFSRGKRGIAGTLVFISLTGHALLSALGFRAPSGADDIPEFLSSKDEYRPKEEGGTVTVRRGDLEVDEEVDFVSGDDSIIDFGAGYTPARAWYVDQIPPFDVTVLAANEYGGTISMRIIGVDLLNEGWGISVDDIVSEKQLTYVCRAISPWKLHEQWRLDYQGGRSTVNTP